MTDAAHRSAPAEVAARAAAIGASRSRVDAARLAAGAGCFADDAAPGHALHAAFLRSPVAHARIERLDLQAARSIPGVFAVFDGEALAPHCRPMPGVLGHLAGMKAAPQWPLARGRVRYVGEPVALVLAERRAIAEDAAQAIEFEWVTLPALVDPAAALQPQSPALHEALGDNLMFQAQVATPGVEAAFARASTVVERRWETARVTAVALEPRGIVARWDPHAARLDVRMGTQVPWMMQAVLADVLGLPWDAVRVSAADTGGSFGSKIHGYADEAAVAVAARLCDRPVRFIADRLESFVSDVHARGHRATVRAAAGEDRLLAFEVEDVCAAGPWSVHPRGSVNESRHVLGLTGACYEAPDYRARIRVAMTNLAQYGQYRGVGHPLACLFTESAVDSLARRLGIDPLAFRLRNLLDDEGPWPRRAPAGATFERLSLRAALRECARLMDYAGLREDQRRHRESGDRWRLRGIGLACFVENSNHSSANYGRGGAPIASEDGALVRLTQGGGIACAVGLTDTGQGTRTALAQIAADAVGVEMDAVRVTLGDTDHTPVSGGNWGSRGIGIAGEALWRAGCALRARLLEAAAALHAREVSALDLREGRVVDGAGQALCTLAELASAIYLRPDRFPPGVLPEPAASAHFAQRDLDGVYTNGASASWVEIDLRSGQVRLLGHWIVDDCGTVINPLLADEQLRGAAVQGIGQALYEGCLYGAEGELRNATLADYLVPMAAEMPDIVVGHVGAPTRTSRLGAKGVAEAGVTGAIAAVVNAIDDALAPLGVEMDTLPVTPERVLRAAGVLETGRDGLPGEPGSRQNGGRPR
jgi:carbon-monoxide dehydrogenase large subunit